MNQSPELDIDIDVIASGPPAPFKVGVAFDANNEPTSGFLIVGKDSEKYRETARLLRIAGIHRGSSKASRIDTKTDEGAAEFDRLLRSNEAEIALAVVVDWFGFNRGGEAVAFSAGALKAVFESRPTWRDKVSAALEADESFLPVSSAS